MHTTSLAVTLISLLAVMSPGPDFIVVTHNSLKYGRKIGFATALGITAGTLLWVSLALIGVCTLIARTVILFNALKWIGVVYLMYLGIKMLGTKKGSGNQQTRDIGKVTCWNGFLNGLITNGGNPKAALFFMSFFSVIITPETPLGWKCLYGYEIPAIACIWFSLVALFLSAQVIKNLFERFSAWIERVTGAILILLGIKLALYRK